MRFSGKVIVTSGSASAMGLLSSKKFLEFGGFAVMSDINKEALRRAVDEVNEIRTGSAIGVVCDVGKYDDVCRVRDAARDNLGRIDLVVPFAGGAERRVLGIEESDFVKIPIEVYDWSIDVNLRSQLYFEHACLAVMKEQRRGSIVHIGSVSGECGNASVIGYSTAKSGAM